MGIQHWYFPVAYVQFDFFCQRTWVIYSKGESGREKLPCSSRSHFFRLSLCLLGFFFCWFFPPFFRQSVSPLLEVFLANHQHSLSEYFWLFYVHSRRESILRAAPSNVQVRTTHHTHYSLSLECRTRKVIRQSRMSRPKRFSFGNYYSAIHARTVHIKAMRQSQGNEDVNLHESQKAFKFSGTWNYKAKFKRVLGWEDFSLDYLELIAHIAI